LATGNYFSSQPELHTLNHPARIDEGREVFKLLLSNVPPATLPGMLRALNSIPTFLTNLPGNYDAQIWAISQFPEEVLLQKNKNKFPINPSTLSVSFFAPMEAWGLLRYLATSVWMELTRLARWLRRDSPSQRLMLIYRSA